MSSRKPSTNDLKITLTNLSLTEETSRSPQSATLVSQLKRQLLAARYDNRMLKEKLRVLSIEFNRLRETATNSRTAGTATGPIDNEKLECGRRQSTLNAYIAKIETLEKQLYEKEMKLKQVQNELYLSRIYQKKCFMKYSKQFAINEFSNRPLLNSSSRHHNLIDSVANSVVNLAGAGGPSLLSKQRCCCTFNSLNDSLKHRYESLAKDNVLEILPKLYFTPKPECKNRNLRFLSCHLDSVVKQIDCLRATVTRLERNQETFSKQSEEQQEIASEPELDARKPENRIVAPSTAAAAAAAAIGNNGDDVDDYSEISEEILIENC